MKEHAAGLDAVRTAMRLCQAVRADLVEGPGRIDKDDRSPVTVADFGSQAVVCRVIRTVFPDDPIVAEEDSAALRRPEHAAQLGRVVGFVRGEASAATAEDVCRWIDLGAGEPRGRYWVLDPIDGTKGFLRNDQYAIALALVEDGQVTRGFLGCPALPREGGSGLLLAAERGGGTQAYTAEGEPLGRLRVSAEADPARARLAESVESAHTNLDLSARVKAALGIAAESVRMDSQAKYAALAAGRAEIYLRSPNPRTPDYRENIWDHAAGWLAVSEAGGTITDVYGRPLDWSHGRRLEANVGILATNGPLHAAVLKVLAPLLPPRG
jgi:3'(2'), 5'-bisphosphate nucleotidase